jgi:hypothetical protein
LTPVVRLALAALLLHHSFAADFDVTKPVTLTGRVTRIEWMNPHVHIYIDSDHERWSIELGSPNGLRERGWTQKTLKIGDVVTIEGSRAKDGTRLANARLVVLASGARMATGSGQGKTS